MKSESELYAFELYKDKAWIQNGLDKIEVLFILQGGGTIQVSHKNTIYSFVENDIFVINAFEISSIVQNEDSAILSLTISYDLALMLFPELESMHIRCQSFLHDKNHQNHFDVIRAKYSRIFMEYSKQDFNTASTRLYVIELLAELVENFTVKMKYDMANSKGREELIKVLNYIQYHYSENISLKMLSEKTYYSQTYLSHFFRKRLNMTFTEYLSTIRLQHAMKFMRKGMTITEISEETGFSSTNAFILTFKKKYGTTPGQFKKKHMRYHSREHKSNTAIMNNVNLYSRLMSYNKKTKHKRYVEKRAEVSQIAFNINKSLGSLDDKFKFCINGGYAKDILLGNIQSMLRQVQSEIKFQYIRFKGVFDEALSIAVQNNDGEQTYNFVLIDEVLDFIISIKATPWVVFDYTDESLVESVKYNYEKVSSSNFPSNSLGIKEYLNLIEKLIVHLIERYGREELRQWIITPSVNDIDYEKDSSGFFSHQAVNIIRRLAPEIKIAFGGYGLDETDEMNTHKNAIDLPDILTIKLFNCIQPEEDKTKLQLMFTNEAFPVIVSDDEDYIKNELKKLDRKMKQYNYASIPIAVSEWNSNIWQRDLCNDTSYKSCYMVKNILENYDTSVALCYWSISDLNELLPANELFHGGFGLFTRNGLPKAAYNAYRLLNKMGTHLVTSGNGFFVSKNKNAIQIYLYNYCKYDTPYRYRHIYNISPKKRYDVFQEKKDIQFYITIEGMKRGNYKIDEYNIGRDGGSVFDEWLKIGAPDDISREGMEALMRLSYPIYRSESIEVEGSFNLKSFLRPHDVKLIIIYL